MKSQKLTISLLALVMGCLIFGQNTLKEFTIVNENALEIHIKVQSRTNEIFDNLVKIRRDFHKHPELSEQEKRTSMKVASYLESLGLEVKKGIGGYGVVGILNTGKPGKHIAWRADIDAIATDIPDVFDFKSNNDGIRHICGHDVHTTIGLGIADVLSSLKQNLTGTVYFIFQPAEEKFTGAKAMINDGLFDMIEPDEIYGLHLSPSPSGTILTKPNNIYAHRTKIEVAYKNADQKDEKINYTKELLSGLQTYDSKSGFWDDRNILSPELGVNSLNSLYKNYVAVRSDFYIDETETYLKIGAIVDASNLDELNAYLESIRKEIKHSKFSNDLLSAEFSYVLGENKSPMNDEFLAKESMNTISRVYGKQNVLPMYGVAPGSFGDDFTFFQKHTPGVYFFLGGSNFEKGIIAMPHTPNFMVDEECIETGVNYFSSMIVERLKN
ncbi:M20 family metallopeptidase [Maribacter sp. 4G9]|uniref:M20 metallopeptidase family protein n=1 Tax=Maribacter sp. 4G9 TaxID=1889777 RepID=UPI000C1494E8|nr:M20 family metallopeptidase [Maribacter sp. 4G9]PIB26962.1 hypothetical protein BFP75_07915 [Maribacter sp. 4G9]